MDVKAPYEMLNDLKVWDYRDENFRLPNNNMAVEVGQAIVLRDNKAYIVTGIDSNVIYLVPLAVEDGKQKMVNIRRKIIEG